MINPKNILIKVKKESDFNPRDTDMVIFRIKPYSYNSSFFSKNYIKTKQLERLNNTSDLEQTDCNAMITPPT